MNGGTLTNTGRSQRATNAAVRVAAWSARCVQPALGLLAFSSIASATGATRSSARTASCRSSSARLTHREVVRGSRASVAAAAGAPGLGRPIALISASAFGVTRDPRPGVAGAGTERHGPADRVAEPEAPERTESLARLVEPRGEPEAVRQGEAGDRARKRPQPFGSADRGPRQRPSEHPQCDLVRSLGLPREEGAPPDRPRPPHRAPIMLAHRERRPRAPHGRGIRAPRRVRPVFGPDVHRLLRQVPVPHRADLLRDVAAEVAALLAPGTQLLGAPEGAAMLLVAAGRADTDLPVAVVRKQAEGATAHGRRWRVSSTPAPSRPCRGREHHRSTRYGARPRSSARREPTCDGSCSRSIAAARTCSARRATRWRRSRCCGRRETRFSACNARRAIATDIAAPR